MAVRSCSRSRSLEEEENIEWKDLAIDDNPDRKVS
jgi:hypothetical protein